MKIKSFSTGDADGLALLDSEVNAFIATKQVDSIVASQAGSETGYMYIITVLYLEVSR